jgi:IS5 family transposase
MPWPSAACSREGTIVDAIVIAAPTSTKSRVNARDPEMRQTKKGNEWHFAIKAHIVPDAGCPAWHIQYAGLATP